MIKKILSACAFLCSLFLIVSFTNPKEEKKLINFKYYCVPNSLNSIEAIANGDWNNATTWSTNQIPTSSDDVTIPKGFTVLLSGTSNARTINVYGTLTPKNLTTDFSITTKAVMVHNGGLFQIGSEANSYTANGLITLTGSDSNETLFSNPFMGAKLIGVMAGGRLELHGTFKKTWTQLNTTAAKGATTITLKETVNWNIGDEIVIASTDFDAHQAEKRTITAINGLVLTLNAPLEYMHFGVEQIYNNGTKNIILDERAEVGLLTHNLKIQGDNSSETNGFGGHIMSMPNSVSKASNIELYRMGQKSKIGKYPWHWHLLGDADGQYIKNAGIHKSFNRVIVVHGTNNTLVEGNVGYDFLGHGYFLENGSETGNMFRNNLGVLCKRPIAGEETTPHDLGIGAQNGAHPEAFPSTFWITNPNNDFIGNVSAGSDGSGFWHLILTEIIDGEESDYVPGIQPMGTFDDNKAHSNLFSWGVDGGIDRDSDEIVNGHYRPQNADGSQFIPIVNRFDGYKSVDRNVWIRANKMDFYDCDFGDNGRADFFSYHQTLFNSLIVGKSANIGNPQSESEMEAGRSLPYANRAVNNFHNAFRGHSIYDGPSGIVDTHFDGFTSIGAKAYCFQTNGASRKSTNHFARGITFGPDVEENSKIEFGNNSWSSFMYLSGLIDEDGSITGTAGTIIRPVIQAKPNSNNLYEKGANTQQTDAIEKPEWGAWLTQNKTYNYFKDIDYTNKSSGAFTPRYFITEYPNKTSHAIFDTQTQQFYFDAPVITNDLDYTYYFQYHKLPRYMTTSLDGCLTNSENVIVAYQNMPGITYAGGATRVSSFANLKLSTTQAYFIKDNTVYFKLISTDTQSEFFQRQFGQYYKYETSSFICNSGNCSDSATWGTIINNVTLIDYSVRAMNLGSIETNNDSRDNAITTDNLTIPSFTYNNRQVEFNVSNNGNGIDGYTDYEINLTSRQVWENFETLNLNYSGPDVEVLIGSKNGTNFSIGTYSSSDADKIKIGQDNEFDKFTNVKKVTLRFHESKIGNINTNTTQNVSINSITLGIDAPETYSQSSTSVGQNAIDSSKIVMHFPFDNNLDDAQSIVTLNAKTANTISTFDAGKFGNAALFNGNPYITSGSTFNAGSSFTIATWVKYNDIAGNPKILHQEDQTGGLSGRPLQITSGNGFFNTSFGESAGFNSTTSPLLNSWFHIALVMDISSDTVKMYINGEEEKSASIGNTITENNNINTQQLNFGVSKNSTTAGLLNGYLDDFMITTEVLTQNQIKAIINLGVTEAQTANTNIWLGITSDYTANTNWSRGLAPITEENVIIPNNVLNNPISSTNIFAKNIVIQKNASLNVGSNNISATATTVYGGGTLIAKGTVSGSFTYKVITEINNAAPPQISGGFNPAVWNLLSAPVVGETVDNDWILDNFIGTGTGANRAVALYDNTSGGSWLYHKNNTSATLQQGVGFSTRKKTTNYQNNNEEIYPFTGTFPDSDVILSIKQGTGNNWNLIGNPFPSYIKVSELMDATNGGGTNADHISDANETVYIWNPTTGTYSGLETSAYIAPGQGFFINAANSIANNFSIPESLQSHQTGVTFYKNKDPKINISINNGDKTRTTYINYSSNQTLGLDRGKDIGLFTGSTLAFGIYSNLLNADENIPLEKQALPNTNFEKMVIPLGIYANAGKQITFSVEAYNLPIDINIYLEDRLKNKYIKLKPVSGKYTLFLEDTQNGIGRFYVHTNTSNVLNTNNAFLSSISIFKSDKNIKIIGLNSEKYSIKIYNTLGKIVQQDSFIGDENKTISIVNLANGIYIAKLQTAKGIISKKIVLE